jgi:serine/threonine-protein kinase
MAGTWDDDETRLSDAAGAADAGRGPRGTRGSDPRSPRTSRSDPRLTTSDIDHGRFQPGVILDDRYRIVGRLGRGGMGEVYRADDLRLGQPVALKFLPESVDRDPARLTQLHTEVRMARQVSHPNVCRVYDIGEFEGHTFLSMEYVDGEDLASLLRRIGRLQEERALELVRQICAGLAAAHDRGVVHRDLKPANIMLDGSGRIRITDFGLAGAAGETLRAGTPAYMAPEQLAGGVVTPRSDIYALGLVLYELFTGKRALEAPTMAELIAKREQADITPPTEVVRGLDASIERVVMRCLEADPARRPPSALAVAAALPGGDPLAAALAAGETPSPEMVAAAGTVGAISTRVAVLSAGLLAAGAIALAILFQHVLLVNHVPLTKTPDALVDRAQEIVARFGYADQVHSTAASMGNTLNWARYISSTSADRDRWAALNTPRPASLYLWYRTSPQLLVPFGSENRVDDGNPPLIVPGMTLTLVDIAGHLAQFTAVPGDYLTGTPGSTDWARVFDAAALPMSAFTAVSPGILPPFYSDERRAWEGRLPERPDLTVHVEAAAFRGHPTYFAITGPWYRPGRAAAPSFARKYKAVMSQITTVVMPGLMLTGVLLARRNVKLGRGDRRGAFRAAAALFVMLMTAWLLGDRHVPAFGTEIDMLFTAVGEALFGAAILWLTYLGLEPYVRRFAPDCMIGWTRLLAGSWRDPRVGRDVLIGVGAGLLMTLIVASHNLIPVIAGRPELIPVPHDPGIYMKFRFPLAQMFERAQSALSSAMLGMAGYTAFYMLLKRRFWAAVVAIVLYTPVATDGLFISETPALDTAIGFAIITVFVTVIARVGLLASAALLMTHFVLLRAAITTDLSSWRVSYGAVPLLTIVGVGLLAVSIALGRWEARGAPGRT